jgi:hypothetical protein
MKILKEASEMLASFVLYKSLLLGQQITTKAAVLAAFVVLDIKILQ